MRTLLLVGLFCCCVAVEAVKISSARRHHGKSFGVIGGVPTTIKEHPYQVALLKDSYLVCSGAILNTRWVITLGSCIVGLSVCLGLEIRAGSDSDLSGGTKYNVTHMLLHPCYDYDKDDYDFALLKTGFAITFGKNVNSIIIANKPPKNDFVGVISGWGIKQPPKYNFVGVISGRRKKQDSNDNDYTQLEMRVLYQKWCVNKYKVTGDEISARMFCAVAGNRGPCFGDFGDPFVINNTLYGLYSWGRGCANPDFPAIFSSIPVVKTWIDANTQGGCKVS